jgi:hypothetical protein
MKCDDRVSKDPDFLLYPGERIQDESCLRKQAENIDLR